METLAALVKQDSQDAVVTGNLWYSVRIESQHWTTVPRVKVPLVDNHGGAPFQPS